MPHTSSSTLSSTPYKNFAKSSSKSNSGIPPKAHTQSRNESRRDGRNSKAFPNGNSPMEIQGAKVIYEVLCMAHDVISRLETAISGTNGSETVWNLGDWRDSTQTTPDLTGEFFRSDPPFPGMLGLAEMAAEIEELSQLFGATSTNTQENPNDGSRKPMRKRPWSTFDYSIPPVESPIATDPVLEETEDVPFQYQDLHQDPIQTLSKPQDNGAHSRGRILAQRRKKRSHGKKTQHSSLDSTPGLSTSAEKQSREDESPSRTAPQLMGRQKLSEWKLNSGKSKDWRRKPFAKTLTTRQFLTAIYSHKKLHYSTFHVESLAMAVFSPDIPVAAQRNRRGKTSLVVRNEFSAFLPWSDRKRFRDMGRKIDHTRDIFDGGDFEVEAHRKLELRPDFPAETDWDANSRYADIIESRRQLQFLQACPSAKFRQNAHLPHYLQIQYIGRVIPSPYGSFQLSEYIESSAHAEVYRICYLYEHHESFAKIYTLRGIHPNQRKRRVENLKKFSQLEESLPAFDWEGKKVCVFSYFYRIKYVSPFGKDPTPKAPGIGAIGRRNTKEYDSAFPPLPPSTPIPVPANVPEEATEPLTPEQKLHIKTLEVIRSEIEETSSKHWESISKESLPLARRLMIRLVDLNGKSVGNRSSEWKVRDCGVQLKNEGNGKWHEDRKGKNSEVKIKKKRGRKKSEKGFIV